MVSSSEPTDVRKLRPDAALDEWDQLDYFEIDMPEQGLGMYLIGGGVEETFIYGEHGAVILPIK